jgi:hypothetical protein
MRNYRGWNSSNFDRIDFGRAGPVNSAQALRSIAIGQRAAAVLLAITIICMSVARYV